MDSKGIGYADDQWKRVEIRCRREEYLFAQTTLHDCPGYAGGTMDWKYWNHFNQSTESWYQQYREVSPQERRRVFWERIWGSKTAS